MVIENNPYDGNNVLTMTAEAGATIRYSFDYDEQPVPPATVTDGHLYNQPVTSPEIPIVTTYFTARAFKNGKMPSDVSYWNS